MYKVGQSFISSLLVCYNGTTRGDNSNPKARCGWFHLTYQVVIKQLQHSLLYSIMLQWVRQGLEIIFSHLHYGWVHGLGDLWCYATWQLSGRSIGAILMHNACFHLFFTTGIYQWQPSVTDCLESERLENKGGDLWWRIIHLSLLIKHVYKQGNNERSTALIVCLLCACLKHNYRQIQT